MNLCSSGVVVRGSDDNQIRVRYSGRDDGGDVKVQFKSNGNRGELEITHCPRNNFKITIDIPKVTDLRVRMFAGQLEVERITGNKDLEIDAGQLTVDIGRAEITGKWMAPLPPARSTLHRSTFRKAACSVPSIRAAQESTDYTRMLEQGRWI